MSPNVEPVIAHSKGGKVGKKDLDAKTRFVSEIIGVIALALLVLSLVFYASGAKQALSICMVLFGLTILVQFILSAYFRYRRERSQ